MFNRGGPMARRSVKVAEVPNVPSVDDLPPPEDVQRRKVWGSVAENFRKWRPAREELTVVRSVPTWFVQFDRATRVGGYPIERITTVHGPSNHGKTEWCIGMIGSFLQLSHAAGLVDAEFTTPIDWVERLIGKDLAEHPAFMAIRPSTYEETANATREFCKVIDSGKASGELPADTSGIVVVDSVRKLIPKGLMDSVLKVAKEDAKTEMLTGRSGQLKAQVTQAWLDELVPMLARTGTGIIMIAREFDKEGASADDKKFDSAWAVAGTRGLIFDASLVIRITRAEWLFDGPSDSKRVIGERHRIRIWKTKVQGKEHKFTDCYYHSSNGVYQPAGFDRARDVVELALHYGIMTLSGSWYSHRGNKVGQGLNQVCKKLNESKAWLRDIEQSVRSEFRPDEELPGGVGDGEED